MPHFFITTKDINGDKIIISDKENFHHIAKVLRAKSGETLLLVDENRTQYKAVIENIDTSIITTKVVEQSKSNHILDLQLYLAQSVLKTDAQNLVIQKATELGVKGIKVDFFDTDKQRIIQLYPAILKDAAECHLLVDLHGATLPRGFERTYPNLLTTEAIRGAETLGRQERCERAAAHNATVPFTRNVVGSMDYTPVTFSNKIRNGVPAIRKTTVAHQLALSVVFESGFQCFADRAEAYQSLPELPKQFLKEVPAAWEESRLLAGYPGDYAVVARRLGDVWYIGGISGKNEEREITFRLPSACQGKGFTLIIDGADKDSFDYQTIEGAAQEMKVKVLPNGGFACRIK